MFLFLLLGSVFGKSETLDDQPDYPSPLTRFVGSLWLVFSDVFEVLAKFTRPVAKVIGTILHYIRISIVRIVSYARQTLLAINNLIISLFRGATHAFSHAPEMIAEHSSQNTPEIPHEENDDL